MGYDQNNQRSWGVNNGGVWCLSTDKYDNRNWEGYSGHGHCFRTLLFAADGKAYYYPSNYMWTPDGRRALEGEGVPTLEDVQDCEQDEARDQKECEDLVDLIFKFDMEHKEALVELGTGVPSLEDVRECENDRSRNQEDCELMLDFIERYEREYQRENEIESDEPESTVDDRRMLEAVNRVVKA